MLPTEIHLENYRAFAQPTRLELRPLTLLFGENNSGKSALLRALPLLEASVGPEATGALDLEAPAARGATFQDLRWKGIEEDEDQDLGIGFRWEDLQAHYRLTWFGEWRRLMVRRLKVSEADGSPWLEVAWEPRREEERASEHTYFGSGPQGTLAQEKLKLGFRGLVPHPGDGVVPRALHQVADHLRALDDQVQWLQAVRTAPERLGKAPGAPKRKLRPDGSDAAAALFADSDLLQDVSSWYEEHVGRRLHEQEVPPGGFRLMLENQQRAELDVDLVDAGEGLIQVLPVLTALEMARKEKRPKILAIEEPESHLHPALQRSLALHLAQVASREPRPRIVLETHSEEVLLGVQLGLMRGELRPEDVRIYWVHQLDTGESLAEEVELDEDARLQGPWPPGVFSEDTEMAREVLRLRRERARP